MSKDLLNTVNDNLKCNVFYLPYFTKRVILHIYIKWKMIRVQYLILYYQSTNIQYVLQWGKYVKIFK